MSVTNYHMAQDTTRIIDVRQSMAVLPTFLQPFLTWLTGKPLKNEKPWRLTAGLHLASCILSLVFGVALSVLAVKGGGAWWLLLPVGWLFTVHAVRKLRSVISHQCAHSNFSGNTKIDTLIGETISILSLTQNYISYRKEHIVGHHSKKHMTVDDPTVAFILLMVRGRVGMSRKQLWRRFWATVFSPWAHLRFFFVRLQSNLMAESGLHITIVLLFWTTVLTLVSLSHTWMVFLLIWVLPLTLILHAAECFRLCGKHVFPEKEVVRNRETLAGFTNGIFIGEVFPPRDMPFMKRCLASVRWFLRLFLLHIPSRMLVAVGDAPCHDYHHRYPNSKDWANYIFARETDAESAHSKWPEYTEYGESLQLLMPPSVRCQEQIRDVIKSRKSSR